MPAKPTRPTPPKAPARRKPAAPVAKARATAKPANRRGEARRDALLETARALFLQHGFAGTSMEELVQRTGGSKASLYSYFGSKEGLFEQMVAEGCASFLRDVAIPTAVEGDLEGTLRAFGMRFFTLYTEPSRVQLMRAIIAEATRFPALAQQLYDNGPRKARIQLAAFFRDCHAEGLMHAPNADLAAIQFITLVKGHCQFRSLFGLSPLGIPIGNQAFIDDAVRLFLHGCQTPEKKTRKP